MSLRQCRKAAELAVRRPDFSRASKFISVADSWRVLARCVAERSGKVVERWLNVLCPWRGRSYHAARPRRDEIWRHSRDVQLPYCVRL